MYVLAPNDVTRVSSRLYLVFSIHMEVNGNFLFDEATCRLNSKRMESEMVIFYLLGCVDFGI